jgi:hypothetical protein
VQEPVAERGAVGVEERLVLGPGAHRREIALDHDGVGVDRTDVGDGAPVHELGVRLVARRRRVHGVVVDTVEDAALDLAEVHVVDGAHRRETLAGRPVERQHVVPVEAVGGVGLEARVAVLDDPVVQYHLVVGDRGEIHGARLTAGQSLTTRSLASLSCQACFCGSHSIQK